MQTIYLEQGLWPELRTSRVGAQADLPARLVLGDDGHDVRRHAAHLLDLDAAHRLRQVRQRPLQWRHSTGQTKCGQPRAELRSKTGISRACRRNVQPPL